MAHEITDRDHLVLTGEKAWHGLGTVVEHAPTAMEALRIARLDWTVSMSGPIHGTWSDDSGSDWSDHRLIRRDDTREVFACVGSGYTPVQNNKLAELADALGGQGMVKIESAGSLNAGRRVWFLLRSQSVEIGRGDEHVPYVMLANSHDGSISLRCYPTVVRVVCANTWRAADKGAGASGYAFRHTSNVSVRVEEIKDCLRQWGQARDVQVGRLNKLAAASISREQIQELWVRVIEACDGPLPGTPTSPGEQRRRDRAAESLAYMARVFDKESSRFGANALVAANAATNWIEHGRGKLDGEARLNSRLFGHYGQLIDQAFTTTEAMMA